MSKGLGITYLDETMCNWHIKDMVNRMYCTVPDSGGIKIAMPRYYKDKLYYENERSLIAEVSQQRIMEKQNKKHDRLLGDPLAYRKLINEQRNIDAAYDRMYYSSLKQKL